MSIEQNDDNETIKTKITVNRKTKGVERDTEKASIIKCFSKIETI